MNVKQRIGIVTLTMTLLIPISSSADILSLGNQPTIAMSTQAPKKGTSMKAVLQKLGEPASRMTAPGKVTQRNPRISVWKYGKMTVYFENNHVIHSLVRH